MRMRFKPAEREAFTVGTEVEWQNVSHWHSGTITGPIAKFDHSNHQHVPLINTSNRGGVPKGELIYGSPGKVRLPVKP